MPVSFDELEIKDKLDSLMPHIVQWLEDKEDMRIREIHKNKIDNVFLPSLTLDAVISELEASETSSRLDADKVKAWFASSIELWLLAATMDKLGVTDPERATSDQLVRLEGVRSAYEKKYISLASGKTVVRKEEADQLINVLTKSGAIETAIGKRFKARLEAQNKSDNELLDLL